jgi:hypothetical protein
LGWRREEDVHFTFFKVGERQLISSALRGQLAISPQARQFPQASGKDSFIYLKSRGIADPDKVHFPVDYSQSKKIALSQPIRP